MSTTPSQDRQEAHWEVGSTRIEVVTGDITEQRVDAIVNAANPSLMGGGGVDGAIHRRGGPAILEECKQRRAELGGPLPRGEAVITTGGELPAKYVIHTAGPVWQGGTRGEDATLANCYRNSLALAVERGLRTVAFPSISTGVYRFPLERASRVGAEAIVGFVEEHPGALDLVRWVAFSPGTAKAMKRALAERLG